MKILLLTFLIFASKFYAQILPQKKITPEFIEAHFNNNFLADKHIDSTFRQQISGALMFYPELKNIKIKFIVKKAISPLSARPSVWAIFQKPKNRQYLIVISSATIKKLEPILLKNLSFNAQIGVLGHEISHIVEFNQKKGSYFFKLLSWQLSKKKMDIFENNTDRRTIEYGLGYQLKDWSAEVRKNLKISQWNGANATKEIVGERYMSPQTIEKIIDSSALYK